MVIGKNRLITMLVDVGRHLRDYYKSAEIMNKQLKIESNNGVDLQFILPQLLQVRQYLLVRMS